MDGGAQMNSSFSAPASTAMTALRGGAVPALAAGGVAIVVFGILDGVAGAASAVLGAVLAVLALAVGPALSHRARGMDPTAVMTLAMAGYVGVVVVLGVAFAVAANVGPLVGNATAVSLVACTFAWGLGQLRATARMRVLAFGSRPPEGGA